MAAEEMSMGELVRTIRYHNRDLYIGDGPDNPPITQRLKSLEDHNSRVTEDLYDKSSGLVPMLRSFFAVLEEREKHKSNQLAKYMAIIAGVGLLSPILWDVIKHTFGFFK